jgi:drug/metabolite transporter (DMT)-like permease
MAGLVVRALSVDKPSFASHDCEMATTDSSPPHIPVVRDRTVRGIGLVIGATLLFASSDACAKLLVTTLAPVEVNWIRSIFAAMLTVAFVVSRKGSGVLVTTHPWRQCGRGLAVFFSSILFLTGLSYLPLADNSAINYVWPIMVTVLSAIFLKEKIGIRRILATIVGFMAMLIMIRPGSSAFQPAAVFPLLAALLWAMGTIMTRGMATDEAPETTIVWSSLVALVASSMMVPFFWTTPTLWQLGIGVVIGVMSAIGHIMVIFAFGSVPPSVLAPYTYVQLIWAVGFGYLMFGTVPDRWIVLGGVIIAASGIYTAHRERIRQQQAAQPV